MNTREENLIKLKHIQSTTSESNWNGYDADPIPDIVFKRASDILNELDKMQQPTFIVPVAKRCIQFEYENDDVYLEFEIHVNHIDGYVHNKQLNFSRDNLLGFTSICIKKYIDEFFKQ